MYELIDQPGPRPRGVFRRADRLHNAGSVGSVPLAEPMQDDSLDALYQASYGNLYAYLRSRTTGDEEAADLTQQVYLQVLRAWERRPVDQAARLPWLFRIARNAATDLHRRRRESVPWEMLPVALHPYSTEPAEAGLVRREVLAHLAQVVAALPTAKRDLLALRFAACLTYAEIAEVLGKREGAVKKEMSRLLKHLRERQDGD